MPAPTRAIDTVSVSIKTDAQAASRGISAIGILIEGKRVLERFDLLFSFGIAGPGAGRGELSDAIENSIPITAITTRSSISVNPNTEF